MESALVQTLLVAAILSGAGLYLLRRVLLTLRPAKGPGGCAGGCGCSRK